MFDAWFDSWSQWTWVAIAWSQLLIVYVGYALYLRWRERNAKGDE